MAAAAPIISATTGAIGLIHGIKAQKKQEKLAQKALTQQDALIQAQLERMRALEPFLQQLQSGALELTPEILANALRDLEFAKTFDPSYETARALEGYDIAARESLAKDFALPGVAYALRGFTQGTQPSDVTGLQKDILGRRAHERAKFRADLLLNELQRGFDVRNLAFQKGASAFGLMNPVAPASAVVSNLQVPISTLGNRALLSYELASGYDPTASIEALARGLENLPWKKKKKQSDYALNFAKAFGGAF